MDPTVSSSVSVVWLTGLSGAGKSTLARAAADFLQQRGQTVVILDGDRLRVGISRDLGFTPADRREQARRCAEIAALLLDQGITVVVALVSPAAADRALARSIIGIHRYHEVYVAAPIAVCVARDPKGLYVRAQAGTLSGLSGLDAPYEIPRCPDLIVDTATVPVYRSIQNLVRWLRTTMAT